MKKLSWRPFAFTSYKFYRLCVRNPASGILQICHKSEKSQWRHNVPTWRHRHFYDVGLFLLSSLVIGSSFMSISSLVLELWQFIFIRVWPEIGNTPVWVLPNIWRLEQVKDVRLGTNVSNEILLKLAKCMSYSFYHFWVIKVKPTGGRAKITPNPD